MNHLANLCVGGETWKGANPLEKRSEWRKTLGLCSKSGVTLLIAKLDASTPLATALARRHTLTPQSPRTYVVKTLAGRRTVSTQGQRTAHTTTVAA